MGSADGPDMGVGDAGEEEEEEETRRLEIFKSLGEEEEDFLELAERWNCWSRSWR